MQLLISVRSVNEAQAALAGGCDLIDIKEPLRGPLGQADSKVIEGIVGAVAGRVPTSVACGELIDDESPELPLCKFNFAKFGLARCRGGPWRELICERRSARPGVVVPAAYADVESANAPDVAEVVEFVIEHRFPVLLIDTFDKCGRTLLDWLSEQRLRAFADRLRLNGVMLALAGSLTINHVSTLRAINPTWMAVRGAVCRDSQREGEIDANLVRSLKALLGA